MREPIENEYFNWLCAKVLSTSGNMYVDLMRILHKTPFVWFIPGDKNRADDGNELKTYFLNESGWENDPEWFSEPCSVLEMLIAFANRASFQTDIPSRDWFWEFMINLQLDECRRVEESSEPVIEEILNTFVWRTYMPNGRGGIFPMNHPSRDQREVEIWYQFCDYLEDRGLV